VIDEGSGPPLLLLHGNPDNADEYKGVIGLLKGEYRCIAPDLPGYGPRGCTFELPASYRYTLEEQVAFVDEVLGALGVGDGIKLVMHDIGGIMGVPWAARNTRRLRGVVFTNTVAYPKFKWFPLAYLFGASGAKGLLADANMELIGLANGRIFRTAFARQNPQLDAAEIERFTRDFGTNRVAKATTRRQFQEITRYEFFDGYDEMLKTISRDVPTATLWGDNDPYVGDTALSERLLARKRSVLPGIGHWVPIVAADRLAVEIRGLV
jgi:haloalkane dehalogenase